MSKIAQSAAGGRHKWLVRTQCLTSAAVCLCSHPNSVTLHSPIPMLASAARSPTVNPAPLAPQGMSLTLRHLRPHANRRQSAWLRPRLTVACVPLHLFTRRVVQPCSIPSEIRNEPERRATNIIARSGPACKLNSDNPQGTTPLARNGP
jgi:hypothetical protein